jgi:hypothetical protein
MEEHGVACVGGRNPSLEQPEPWTTRALSTDVIMQWQGSTAERGKQPLQKNGAVQTGSIKNKIYAASFYAPAPKTDERKGEGTHLLSKPDAPTVPGYFSVVPSCPLGPVVPVRKLHSATC